MALGFTFINAFNQNGEKVAHRITTLHPDEVAPILEQLEHEHAAPLTFKIWIA